jgi:hypothetical protein
MEKTNAISRRGRGRGKHVHFHQHNHQHYSQALRKSLTIRHHQPPPVPLVPTMQTLVNAPVRIDAPTENHYNSPSSAAPPQPVIQQSPQEGWAGFITGLLSAFVLGASLLSNHNPKSRR